MPTTRPNILLIMADQFRHDYFGAAGADWVRTPNLDALAEQGVRFTQCCTNAPVCAPARIGLASGLQPRRLGALNNHAFLPVGVPTYYQRLRDAEYRVGCVGKLDLAKPDPYNGRYGDRPCVYGWGFTHPEECEGKMHAGRGSKPHGPYTHYLHERGLLQAFADDYAERAGKGWVAASYGDSVLPADAFEDAYIGRRAAEWVSWAPDDYPWHYFVSFVGPHNPFDPPTEYADRYRHAPMPTAIPANPEGKPRWTERRRVGLSDGEIAVTRRQYCAAIELIDDQIGDILAALDARGQRENTYIIFSSDHGEMLGDHGMYTKSVPYESALRVPLLIAGPGIEGGRVSDALVELIDVNPTICALAGLPPQERIDARDVTAILHGGTDPHRADCVSSERNFMCLRTDRHKLVLHLNDTTELYDLQEDPDERWNIAAEHPALVRNLTARLELRYQEGKWLR